MAKTVGIDLGTTNSVVAVLEGGQPVVIANSEGHRTTPSVVAFTSGGERLVGTVAKRQAIMNPEGTLYSVKRFVGRNYDEVTEEAKIVPYHIEKGPNDAVRIKVGDKSYAPEEISARVLRKLADDASAYLGEKVTDAVVTVPAYFNDAQRQATKDAGKIAGLNVLRVVNEPTAAALAYGMDKKKNETVMVFDLGGGTFDVSILEVGDGVCEVKSTAGDTHLGGDDFDKVVVDFLSDEFKKDNGIDLRQDRQALQRLYEAAEKAKCELSSTSTTNVNLPFITADQNGPKHLNVDISRAKFDELTRKLVERCMDPIKQAISDAKLKAEEIDEVILVGGSTRIPAVQDLVKKFTAGKQPNMSVNPDEVVAMGAAVQAGILKGEVEDVVLLDVTPLSLGVETMGAVMTKIIERNTTIPASRSETFSTAADNQPAVDIVVLQGEREMAKDNRTLGTFKLEGIRPAPRGVPQIEVTFDIDANGILNVSAKDTSTGKEQKITISGSTNLDQGDIDKMVRDAEAHAEEDKAIRAAVEARNKLDAVSYRVEHLIQEMGDNAPAHEKSRAEQLIEEARQAVKDQAPLDRVHSLTSDLEQVAAGLSQHAQAAPQGEPTAGTTADTGQAGGSGGGDDVIDAEFEKND